MQGLASHRASPPYQQSPDELNQTIQTAHQQHSEWNERLVSLARGHLGQPYALYLLGEAPFETIDEHAGLATRSV